MNAVTPTSPEPAALSHWAEHRLESLQRSMDAVVQLIESQTRRSLAAEVEEPAQRPRGRDEVGAVVRLAKSLRQTVALSARVEAGEFPPLREAGPSPKRAAADREHPNHRKRRVRRAIEDSILNEASGERAEDLMRDLRERLDDPEFESDFDDKPIGLVVAAICHDLGIHFEERRWTHEELGNEAPDDPPPGDPPPDDPPPCDPLAPLAIEPQMPRHHSGRGFRLQDNWQLQDSGQPLTTWHLQASWQIPGDRPPDTDPAPD